jgi:murein L,D-transpeptidase YcbB/YkuD
MPARPLLAALLLTLSAGPLPAQSTLLRRLIERGRHPSIHWGRFSDVQAEARALYARNGWAPLWMARGRPTLPAHALLDALATVGDRGLNAEDYDATQLAALAATLDRRGADVEQAVRFDAALTIGAFRLVQALAHGRIGPRQAQGLDAAGTVEQLRGTTEPGPLLSALEPQRPQYQLLKRAVARYRALARDSVSLRLPRPGSNGVREGSRYTGAARLRRLLGALGDLGSPAAAPREGDSVLTPELADGIRAFQARQGTRIDGRLNETTWRLLTSHFGRRIRQMELALERWRWLPRELEGTPSLFISVPAMRAHYGFPTREGDFFPIAMSITLGSRFPQERPVLAGVITMLRFTGADRELGSVTFMLSGNPGFSLSGSAPGNPVLQEPTPRSIRVADGALLARLLLFGWPEWTSARIQAAMAGSKPVYVRLRQSVPVLVVYGTAVARENGQVFFYDDGFGQDKRLEGQLAAGYPFR